MIVDTMRTIEVSFLKMYFIGPTESGKSLLIKRLTGQIKNVVSLPPEQRETATTLVTEHSLTTIDSFHSVQRLDVTSCSEEEEQMMLAYAYSNDTNPDRDSSGTTIPDISLLSGEINTEDPVGQNRTFTSRIDMKKIIAHLLTNITSSKYSETVSGKILLNLIDVGYEPGVLEMLPVLSRGPAMFLTAFRIDQDLDQPWKVPNTSKENMATLCSHGTIREKLLQILSAISHQHMHHSDGDQDILEKLGMTVGSAKPVLTLVGTFKDRIEKKTVQEVLLEKIDEKIACVSIRNRDSSRHDESLQQIKEEIDQQLRQESFYMEVTNRLEQKLEQKQKELTRITQTFENVVDFPESRSLLAVDNYSGEENDLEPLFKYLEGVFQNNFKKHSLVINPTQLLLGIILRGMKEYNIVSMDICIQIGSAMKMEEEVVRSTLCYLDRVAGLLIYHPEIDDKDGWFKQNVICNPQIVFDSILSLLYHPFKESKCKGIFSLKNLSNFLSEETLLKVQNSELIPLEQLINLLEHSHLLTRINSEKIFIPAFLDVASIEEPPSPDANTPTPIKITFERGYVPLGVFCAVIRNIVSKGQQECLGLKWQLVESSVKKNLVQFQVGLAEHEVVLITHIDCYEIRVKRKSDKYTSIYDLCSYVLTVVLYVIKEINNNITPIIAFDCKCGQHNTKNPNPLCHLSSDMSTYFTCEKGRVSLTESQELWFVKVSLVIYL